MTDLLGSLSGAPGPSGPDAPQCSRRGCRAPARWRLRWNNPRIHPPERRKEWLACGQHRDWLQTYLSERGLWRETLPLDGAAPEEAAPEDTAPGATADGDGRA